MKCSIDECERPAFARGWCSTHYSRWQRHGDPLYDKPRGRPLAERFWEKVTKSDDLNGCWLWTGYRNRTGYGTIGPGGQHRSDVLATNVSWELHNGPIPDGLNVLHNCPGGDNPACVNPAHLWLGTHADNMADMVAKGRASHVVRVRGSSHPRALLTEEQVREIRRRYKGHNNPPQRVLAAEFGVDQTTISSVLHGRWKHA